MSAINNTPATSTQLVTIDETRNVPMTTSLKVAEVFGKLHKDVLKAIRNLDCSQDFNQRNFAPVTYADAKGEERTMYLMTRDGFTFLAMGFNGAKAAEFKERYISEFNRMEAFIKEQVQPQYALPRTFSEALRALADETDKNERLTAENAVMLPKAEVYDRVVADKRMKVHEFARHLKGVNSICIKKDLEREGYLHKTWGTYRVYSKYRDTLFVEKVNPSTGKTDIYVTDGGKKEITKLYVEGSLTMKAGY